MKLWLLATSIWCEPPFRNVLCLGFSTACQPHNAGAQWSCWVNETSHLLQLTQQLPAVLIQLGSLRCHGLHVFIFTLPETPTQQYRLLYIYMSAWNTNTAIWVALHVYVCLKPQHSDSGYFTCIYMFAWNTNIVVQVTLHVRLPETPTQWYGLFYMYMSAGNTNTAVSVTLHAYACLKHNTKW